MIDLKELTDRRNSQIGGINEKETKAIMTVKEKFKAARKESDDEYASNASQIVLSALAKDSKSLEERNQYLQATKGIPIEEQTQLLEAHEILGQIPKEQRQSLLNALGVQKEKINAIKL